MSALETETGLEERDELVGESSVLVKLDEGLELFGVDDEVKTANLRETELLLVDTSSVDLLPHSARCEKIRSN